MKFLEENPQINPEPLKVDEKNTWANWKKDPTSVDESYKAMLENGAFLLLREERDRLLAETDWTQNRDVTLSNDADWKTYRQALRDITKTAKPSVNEVMQLTDVTWPTAPTE